MIISYPYFQTMEVKGMSVIYRHTYTNSWALIIGINKYKHASHLRYACNDAEALATMLIETYQFPEENITVLLDEEATKANIMSKFLQFADDKVQVDDRIIVFYAGHGHTIRGRRGDIGFLVPYDGTSEDYSTFIRWDDLTRNSELIRAKHILYIMDACYSGLAITRSIQPGSVRFLKDMLKRSSRQVLTAGKANEVVADANGPIAGNSIFTGHLLQALKGYAEKDGVMTANGVMSYVYEKVSNDQYSEQTPHFGFIEGDGDFIFRAPILDSPEDEGKTVDEILVEIPAVLHERSKKSNVEIIDETKEYLTEVKSRIKLDDLVNHELRKVISILNEENFPLQGVSVDSENFVERLNKYEQTVKRIGLIVSCVAHWGEDEQSPIINKILSRLSDGIDLGGGTVLWLKLRWYPLLMIMYYGGISALANENYEYLSRILTTKVKEEHSNESQVIVVRVIKQLTEIYNSFKMIPEHDRYHVPRSEYLFKILQPDLDDLLFLGKSYDELFDRFEIFLALVYADLNPQNRTWGPVGRFGWKYHRTYNIYSEIVREADRLQNNWPPIKVGLFNGSYDRFKSIATEFEKFLRTLSFY
jgi:hypothetical protein